MDKDYVEKLLDPINTIQYKGTELALESIYSLKSSA